MKKPSKYKYLLDPGHGGMIDDVYQTSGKRSPIWEDGSVLYEGEFNRAIAKRVKKMCDLAGIDCSDIVNSEQDIPLRERVKRANQLYAVDKRCVYISIHANAGGGTGFEVFTSPGETKSDPIATTFFLEFGKEFPDVALRKDMSDGDVDKEAKFFVLTNTNCPAILLESFFMDREDDCKNYLMNESERDNLAEAYFSAILKLEGDD